MMIYKTQQHTYREDLYIWNNEYTPVELTNTYHHSIHFEEMIQNEKYWRNKNSNKPPRYRTRMNDIEEKRRNQAKYNIIYIYQVHKVWRTLADNKDFNSFKFSWLLILSGSSSNTSSNILIASLMLPTSFNLCERKLHVYSWIMRTVDYGTQWYTTVWHVIVCDWPCPTHTYIHI